jgi:hypothetical protein
MLSHKFVYFLGAWRLPPLLAVTFLNTEDGYKDEIKYVEDGARRVFLFPSAPKLFFLSAPLYRGLPLF